MERQWFVATRAGVLGPMEGAGVVALVRSGGARPDTQVCTADEHQWIQMRHVPELAREMARQDAMPWPEPHVPVPLPPPPPGEPWFYDVPVGRAVALQWVSFGLYFSVWQYRHESWLRRRAPLQGSEYDDIDSLLAGEVASAAARLGLPADPRLRLPATSDGLDASERFFRCFWPIEMVMDLWFLRKVQTATEIVNREVAPGAARPLMGLGEWLAVAGGVVVWFLMALVVLGHFHTP
jgi:hypothetical protein